MTPDEQVITDTRQALLQLEERLRNHFLRPPDMRMAEGLSDAYNYLGACRVELLAMRYHLMEDHDGE